MPIAGFLTDKIKSSSIASIIGLILLLASAIGFFVSGVRGIYYATMNEAKISKALLGTAIGIISTIGFSPDAFIFLQVGGWLDKYSPEKAYKMIFVYMMIPIVIAICSAVCILILSSRKSKQQ